MPLSSSLSIYLHFILYTLHIYTHYVYLCRLARYNISFLILFILATIEYFTIILLIILKKIINIQFFLKSIFGLMTY